MFCLSAPGPPPSAPSTSPTAPRFPRPRRVQFPQPRLARNLRRRAHARAIHHPNLAPSPRKSRPRDPAEPAINSHRPSPVIHPCPMPVIHPLPRGNLGPSAGALSPATIFPTPSASDPRQAPSHRRGARGGAGGRGDVGEEAGQHNRAARTLRLGEEGLLLLPAWSSPSNFLARSLHAVCFCPEGCGGLLTFGSGGFELCLCEFRCSEKSISGRIRAIW
jgi:hypothetical protein